MEIKRIRFIFAVADSNNNTIYIKTFYRVLREYIKYYTA